MPHDNGLRVPENTLVCRNCSDCRKHGVNSISLRLGDAERVSLFSADTATGVWIGANVVAQIQAFDGAGGTITSDGTHFWPYGLNYDSEGNTESYCRHVLMMASFCEDMGIQ